MTLRRRDDRRLGVRGLVENPGSFSPDEIAAFPGLVEDRFDAPAVPVSSLLEAVVVGPGADHVTAESGDGHYRASIPLADAVRGGWLLLGQPAERGGPVRLVVEEGRTLCWNVKWLAGLRFTAGPEPDSVPENPPH